MSDLRELDVRHGDGIEVRLLWSKAEDRVTVAVEDGRTGRSFVVEVHGDESALDVFHHPYAYAVWHEAAAGSEGLELITARAA